jgi:DHA2 family multidrug resistance protein
MATSTAAADPAGSPHGAAASPPAPPAVPAPLSGMARAVGTFALSAATFMVVLDTSIANVSIPAIAGDVGVSTSQGTWVITSFAVSNAIAVPLTGWLTQRFGSVRVFSLSALLFVLFSWLCGLAPNIESLIAFRVMQGLVAGPLIPLSQSLLLSSYPKEKAGTALAMWAMTTLVAPVAGPLLGGWITDNYSWPWIFYINIPVGLLAVYLTWSIFHRRETPTQKLPIDKVGLALLVVWIAALQIMLDKGKELDWFESREIIALALIALVGFVFFLIWELTDEHPVVDLRLFAGSNFAIGTLSLAVAYGLFFANIVILPLWLQTQMGYTATDAGYVLAPVGFLALLVSPLVGRGVGRVDARYIASTAFVLFAVVSFMRANFNAQVDMVTLIIPTIIQGAAVACFFIPLVTITLSGLPPHRIPSAAGLSNFARITAGAFGTSISTTLWDNRAAMHHVHLTESINAGNAAAMQTLSNLQASGLDRTQSLALLDRLINVQAYVLSADDIFYASAIIFLLLVPVLWSTHPGRGHPAAAGAVH